MLSFNGCHLVVGGYSLQLLHMNRLGIKGGLASAMCAAGYTLLGECGMHRYGPSTVLFYALAFAALTWHLIYLPFTMCQPDLAGTSGDGFYISL